ncbi:MAG: UDP-glucose 4-epimerase GalE [Candidatus Levybacteria bacterium]|nr:UDP-glucose 4-epimerase GalE [Candidatus Levybacteria bacterium]
MKILVTGGAGYIGSITVKRLLESNIDVVVFDNLKYGHREAVSCKLVVGDLTNYQDIEKGLENEKFDAVIHFAAYTLAGESMENPHKYFHNNIMGGLNLLKYMRLASISNIVFSSTCAIFGTPIKMPVSEDLEKKPESVYGESKLMFENILSWYDKIYGIKHMNLRYFNAAGASLDGSLGESHDSETHIIPLVIQTALKKREKFTLFGDDYPTKDGTCIRDYIHVEDLATVHILALNKLRQSNQSDSFNIGTGKGYTNKEVVDMVRKVSGVDFSVEISKRRFGDPSEIYADNNKAKNKLGFEPKYSDLETIVKSAWEWHNRSSEFKVQSSK